MLNESNLFEKLHSCLGIATGLRKILYDLIETKIISDKDYNCILSLSKCLECSLENLFAEMNTDN